MTEQQRQHLSTLADGELDAALVQPTVSALESSSDMRATWERYHLISSVLRGEVVTSEYREIAMRVRERLQTDPTVLAPRRITPKRRLRLGPFVGIGLAAGAAFFAVFALPQLFDPAQRAVAPTPVASLFPPQQFRLTSPARRWHLEQPGLEHKLDQFLVNHQARSPASGIKGFIPYATVVGYEASR